MILSRRGLVTPLLSIQVERLLPGGDHTLCECDFVNCASWTAQVPGYNSRSSPTSTAVSMGCPITSTRPEQWPAWSLLSAMWQHTACAPVAPLLQPIVAEPVLPGQQHLRHRVSLSLRLIQRTISSPSSSGVLIRSATHPSRTLHTT